MHEPLAWLERLTCLSCSACSLIIWMDALCFALVVATRASEYRRLSISASRAIWASSALSSAVRFRVKERANEHAELTPLPGVPATVDLRVSRGGGLWSSAVPWSFYDSHQPAGLAAVGIGLAIHP